MNSIRRALKWVVTFTPPSAKGAVVVDQGSYDPRGSRLQQISQRTVTRVIRIGGAVLAALAIVFTTLGAYATSSHALGVGDSICKALGGDNTGYSVAPINSAGSLLAPKNYRTITNTTGSEQPGSTDPGAYTWAEEARGISLRWSTTTKEHKESSDKEASCNLADSSENAVANNIFGFSQTISNLAVYIRSITTTGVSPFDSLYTEVEPCRYEGCPPEGVVTDGPLAKLVNNLRDYVFIPSLTLAIISTGIWVIFNYRQENHRKAFAGLSWMVVSSVLSSFLLFNHVELISGAQNMTSKLVADADAGLAWIALNGGDEADESNGTGFDNVPVECRLRAEEEEAQKVPASTRTSSCMIWYSFSYSPWMQGQFGTSAETRISTKASTGSDINGRYSFNFAQMRSQAYLLIDFYRANDAGGETIDKALLDRERQKHATKKDGIITMSYQEACENLEGAWLADGTTWFGSPDPDKGSCVKNEKTGFVSKTKMWEELRDELAERKGAASMYSTWQGKTVADRTNIAVGTSIASLFYSGTVIFASALTLFWEALQHFLLVILPIVAAFATWPPLQKVLRGWGETYLKSFILRVGLGIVTALLMAMYVIVFTGVQGMWQQVILFVLFGCGALWLINYLRSDVTKPNLGGGSTDVEAQAQKPIQQISNVGGAVGGVIGAGAGYIAGQRSRSFPQAPPANTADDAKPSRRDRGGPPASDSTPDPAQNEKPKGNAPEPSKDSGPTPDSGSADRPDTSPESGTSGRRDPNQGSTAPDATPQQSGGSGAEESSGSSEQSSESAPRRRRNRDAPEAEPPFSQQVNNSAPDSSSETSGDEKPQRERRRGEGNSDDAPDAY